MSLNPHSTLHSASCRSASHCTAAPRLEVPTVASSTTVPMCAYVCTAETEPLADQHCRGPGDQEGLDLVTAPLSTLVRVAPAVLLTEASRWVSPAVIPAGSLRRDSLAVQENRSRGWDFEMTGFGAQEHT